MASRNARTIYLPTDRARVEALRSDGRLDECEAWSLTPEFARQYELDLDATDDAEEADYWLLMGAAARALTASDTPQRWVLAARVDEAQLDFEDRIAGRARVRDLAWSQASALFVDEAEASDALAAARQRLRSSDADEAAEGWQQQAGIDLLWYLPDELDAIDA